MTAEGFAESEDEIQAVIRSEGFRRHDQRLREAKAERDTARVTGLLAAVRRRYGPRLAEGLAEWHAED